MNKALLIFLGILLSACSSRENVSVNKSVLTPEEMLAKIHAENNVSGEVSFQAMPDEAVLDLREKASQAQQRGELDSAVQLLNQALAVNDKDPEAMQMLAELAILQESFDHAERMARRSYEFGPKLGGLCRRNWLTVHYAKMARGLSMPESQLAKSLAECTIVPPARM